jgi:hypothetical protein
MAGTLGGDGGSDHGHCGGGGLGSHWKLCPHMCKLWVLWDLGEVLPGCPLCVHLAIEFSPFAGSTRSHLQHVFCRFGQNWSRSWCNLNCTRQNFLWHTSCLTTSLPSHMYPLLLLPLSSYCSLWATKSSLPSIHRISGIVFWSLFLEVKINWGLNSQPHSYYTGTLPHELLCQPSWSFVSRAGFSILLKLISILKSFIDRSLT